MTATRHQILVAADCPARHTRARRLAATTLSPPILPPTKPSATTVKAKTGKGKQPAKSTSTPKAMASTGNQAAASVSTKKTSKAAADKTTPATQQTTTLKTTEATSAERQRPVLPRHAKGSTSSAQTKAVTISEVSRDSLPSPLFPYLISGAFSRARARSV